MKCPRCYTEVKDTAKFCENCGFSFDIKNNQPQPTYQSQPTYQQQPAGKKQKPLYTQKWFLICIVLIIFLFAGAYFTQNKTSSDSSNDNSSYYDDNNVDYEYEDYTPDNNTSVNFKTGQIFKGHKVKISVTGGQNDIVSFCIENDSKKDYSFDVHSCSINSIMTNCNEYTMSTNVPSHKKANTELDLSEWLDKDVTVEYVELMFWVYSDSFKSFDTGILTIKTDAFNTKHDSFTTGKQKVNHNNLSVSYLGNDNNTLTFSLINHNDYLIDFDLRNCSVNGWSYDTLLQAFDVEVYPHSQTVFSVEISDEFLEKNSIIKLKDIEFNLDVRQDGDYFKESKTKKFIFKL